MRAAAGGRTTGSASSTLPACSVYSPAGFGIYVVEIGLFNTTTTAVNVGLQRFTTAGTAAAGTEVYVDGDGTPSAAAFGTHTAGPTITSGVLRQATLGAANGAGVIWTGKFWVPKGVANGIGITIPNGSAQIMDWYIEWEE